MARPPTPPPDAPTSVAASTPGTQALVAQEVIAEATLPPLPTLRSPDGRFVLGDAELVVAGERFSLRELERAEVAHVRWVLWLLMGGLGLAAVLIGFLRNELHTLPAALGMVLTASLLAYGQRGTNRLRLWRLGPYPWHVTLPGELAPWQRLVAELNRRIARAHDQAAREAAALLAAEAPPAAAPEIPLP